MKDGLEDLYKMDLDQDKYSVDGLFGNTYASEKLYSRHQITSESRNC